MKLFLYPSDYHNVKVLLKAEALKTDPAPLLLESAAIPPQEMQEMIRKRDFALLSVSMKQAITEAAELFAKSRDPQEIDIILDRACYRDMLEEAEKLDNAFVTGYVKLLIDSLNMSAFIRLRKIGKSRIFSKRFSLRAETSRSVSLRVLMKRRTARLRTNCSRLAITKSLRRERKPLPKREATVSLKKFSTI